MKEETVDRMVQEIDLHPNLSVQDSGETIEVSVLTKKGLVTTKVPHQQIFNPYNNRNLL